MKLALMLVCVLLLAGQAWADPIDAIPWQDAEGHVGEEQTVEGRVVAARREGNVLRITFDNDPESFSVALIASLFSPLPANPASIYEGRIIQATGKIRTFRGVSEMVVRDASQILILAAEPEPSPTRSAGLEDRVDQLEHRVEELERRLNKK